MEDLPHGTIAPDTPAGSARKTRREARSQDLVIVGTGIRTVGQMTQETICWIEQADRVFHVVGDPVAESMCAELNPEASITLRGFYEHGKDRMTTYQEMVATILAAVRGGELVVGAFYGHPGVFAYPSHESVRQARAEGYRAVMLPGISAEDCLFADLNVDPATHGCQSYEATDFLLNGRVIDPTSSVILWQIGVLANWDYKGAAYDLSAMPVMVARLSEIYPPTHVVYIYEASTILGCPPVIRPVQIQQLPVAGATPASTLYIPPAYAPRPDPRYMAMLGRTA
ncbi:MAG: SAM-dependent methyltransferase [Pseudomonadota bacterium]